jgi:hypothetical protein
MPNVLEGLLVEFRSLRAQVQELERKMVRPLPDGEWTDYSSTATITGWGSYSYKSIWYKEKDGLVYVSFWLQGASNSANASFSLPYQVGIGNDRFEVVIGHDNGGANVPARVDISGLATSVPIYRTLDGASWTASGDKFISGSFWYIRAA